VSRNYTFQPIFHNIFYIFFHFHKGKVRFAQPWHLIFGKVEVWGVLLELVLDQK